MVCVFCGLIGTISAAPAPTALVEELLHVSSALRDTTHVSNLAHELAEQFAHDAIARFHTAADRIDSLAHEIASDEGEDESPPDL